MGNDPDEKLAGVTDLALNLPLNERLVPTALDVGESSVVVQVKEFKEQTTAPFNEVRSRVATAIKTTAARKLAEQRANELLGAVKAAGADFAKESNARKATVLAATTISRAKADAASQGSMTSAVRSAVFALATPGIVDRVLSSNGSFTVVAVTHIRKPESATSKDVLAKYQEQAREENSRRSLESAVDILKASAELDIDQTLLINQ
jgi:hypothetical protein